MCTRLVTLARRTYCVPIVNGIYSKVNMPNAMKSIKDFGYGFNDEGELRKLDNHGNTSDKPFQFNVFANHQDCQKHYEDLGEAITLYVYNLLEKQEKLIKLTVPKDAKDKLHTFVFASKDYDKKDKLLVLIHGSGVVRAGQWARSLIINDNIYKGSQIPYIRKALSKNYGVIILNTNDNYNEDGNRIPHSGDSEQHAAYVWENYVTTCSASSIFVVAHSYGGVVTLTLADKMKNDFERRVKAIAFTDSVHVFANAKLTKHLIKKSRNWVSSSEPLDTPISTPEHDIPRFSAGHPKHEMTSHSCMESVFKFIEELKNNEESS